MQDETEQQADEAGLYEFTQRNFRDVLGHYPTGVCVITSMTVDQDPLALVVGTFNSVSLAPPLVTFFVQHNSRTWPQIEINGRFCVNVLSENQADLCDQIARGGPNREKYIKQCEMNAGIPNLTGALAWINCVVHDTIEAGDHTIVLGRVTSFSSDSAKRPLCFHRGILTGLRKH